MGKVSKELQEEIKKLSKEELENLIFRFARKSKKMNAILEFEYTNNLGVDDLLKKVEEEF